MKNSLVLSLIGNTMRGNAIVAEEKKKVFAHITNNHNRSKKFFPGSLAISFDIDERKLHQDFREYLEAENKIGNLNLDSVNPGLYKISYIVDFQRTDAILEIFNRFFKNKEISRFGVFESDSLLTLPDLIDEAKAVLARSK